MRRIRCVEVRVTLYQVCKRIVLELKDKVGVAAEWEASSAKNAPSPDDVRLHDGCETVLAVNQRAVD